MKVLFLITALALASASDSRADPTVMDTTGKS
jgi:hypothetical protein